MNIMALKKVSFLSNYFNTPLIGNYNNNDNEKMIFNK